MLQTWYGICLWLAWLSHLTEAQEHFTEDLHIRPLRDGRLYTQFVFKTLLEGAVPRFPSGSGVEDQAQHYTVFPLALGQIIREYAVTELHLSLNTGKWDYSMWGYPNDPSVGSGAELWTWMGDPGDNSYEGRWKGLRNALAGLFCASLGELDERRTTSPVHAFYPDGDLPSDISHRLAYASLPSERICTENLTPFLKLLPCKSRSGIAQLLNPHRLFDADWHGMSVRVFWRNGTGVEVQLSIQAVFDSVRLGTQGKRDWSFAGLFERTINAACPVAKGRIILNLPTEDGYSLLPEPTNVKHGIAVYDVEDVVKPLNIILSYVKETAFIYPFVTPSPVPLFVSRSHSGVSQSSGRFHITFRNSLNVTQHVAYLETFPWFIKPHLSTLTLSSLSPSDGSGDDILQHLNYIPTSGNAPTLLEPTLLLPPLSTVFLTLGFEKAFLRYTEHPPDAQRGWDLPAAVLVPLDSPLPRIYTSVLLVDLATPDFSMPYNVIIMSSTLVALLFGSIFNLLTREFLAVRVE